VYTSAAQVLAKLAPSRSKRFTLRLYNKISFRLSDLWDNCADLRELELHLMSIEYVRRAIFAITTVQLKVLRLYALRKTEERKVKVH